MNNNTNKISLIVSFIILISTVVVVFSWVNSSDTGIGMYDEPTIHNVTVVDKYREAVGITTRVSNYIVLESSTNGEIIEITTSDTYYHYTNIGDNLTYVDKGACWGYIKEWGNPYE